MCTTTLCIHFCVISLYEDASHKYYVPISCVIIANIVLIPNSCVAVLSVILRITPNPTQACGMRKTMQK